MTANVAVAFVIGTLFGIALAVFDRRRLRGPRA